MSGTDVIELLVALIMLKIIINMILPDKRKKRYKKQKRANKKEYKEDIIDLEVIETKDIKQNINQNIESNNMELWKKREKEKQREKEREEKVKKWNEKKTNETKNAREIYEKNKKERYKQHLKEIKDIGDVYEKHIGKYYENLGYKVIYNGLEKGKKDEGIDLIVTKDDEATFIQCKNWKKNAKYKINHEKISSFVGKTFTYIEKNTQWKEYKIKRLYIASNDIFDRTAKRYCRENRNIIEYMIIPYKEA